MVGHLEVGGRQRPIVLAVFTDLALSLRHLESLLDGYLTSPSTTREFRGRRRCRRLAAMVERSSIQHLYSYALMKYWCRNREVPRTLEGLPKSKIPLEEGRPKPFVRILLEQEPESTVVDRVTRCCRNCTPQPILNSVDCEDFRVG